MSFILGCFSLDSTLIIYYLTNTNQITTVNLKCIYSIVCCLCISMLSAQNHVDQRFGDAFQFGVSGKLSIEFQTKVKPTIRCSATTGIGYQLEGLHLFPTVHAGILLFNTGAIGSDLSKPWHKFSSHLFLSTTATAQLDKRSYSYEERYVPLYHFADFTANPLQNPYKSSISFGAIWIRMSEHQKQRIGFVNGNFYGRAQISYYNDGGPVLKCIGDKRDRYYTGGLTISYHGNEHAAIDLIELSYHKFTGYVKHAFDVADKLQQDFLVYADTSQFAYNHQRWKLNVADLSSGFAGHIALYDVNRLDLQDFLHFSTNVPYHPDYNTSSKFAFGGQYQYNSLWLRE